MSWASLLISICASNFKSICSRQKDFEVLATRLLKGTKIQTAAMKYGLEHEDEVAQFYLQNFGRSVFKVGFVINPRLPHLGCSLDRREHDPSESSPWGLFEIKCSMAEELKDIKYLKKKSHYWSLLPKKELSVLFSGHGLCRAHWWGVVWLFCSVQEGISLWTDILWCRVFPRYDGKT